MKKISLFISLVLLSALSMAQSVGHLRYDSVRVYKVGGNAELILENATRNVPGSFIANKGNGRTEFAVPRYVDSVAEVGDSIFLYNKTLATKLAAFKKGGSSLASRYGVTITGDSIDLGGVLPTDESIVVGTNPDNFDYRNSFSQIWSNTHQGGYALFRSKIPYESTNATGGSFNYALGTFDYAIAPGDTNHVSWVEYSIDALSGGDPDFDRHLYHQSGMGYRPAGGGYGPALHKTELYNNKGAVESELNLSDSTNYGNIESYGENTDGSVYGGAELRVQTTAGVSTAYFYVYGSANDLGELFIKAPSNWVNGTNERVMPISVNGNYADAFGDITVTAGAAYTAGQAIDPAQLAANVIAVDFDDLPADSTSYYRSNDTIYQVRHYYDLTSDTAFAFVDGGGVVALDDLVDVDAPAPVANDYLKFNGTDWINQPPAEVYLIRGASGAEADSLYLTNGIDTTLGVYAPATVSGGTPWLLGGNTLGTSQALGSNDFTSLLLRTNGVNRYALNGNGMLLEGTGTIPGTIPAGSNGAVFQDTVWIPVLNLTHESTHTGFNALSGTIQVKHSGSNTMTFNPNNSSSILDYIRATNTTSGNRAAHFVNWKPNPGSASTIELAAYRSSFSHNSASDTTSIWANIQGPLIGFDASDNYYVSKMLSGQYLIGFRNKNGNNYFHTATGFSGFGHASGTALTSKVDISTVQGYNQFRLRTTYTPTGTADTNGNTGDMAWDADYIYIKTGAGWKRTALSTF